MWILKIGSHDHLFKILFEIGVEFMRKKILAAVIALACSLSLSACAPSQGVTLEFSEYYQSADNFEEIEPLLNQYFSMVQAAYDNSDKTNLESFVLGDGYEEVADSLTTMQTKLFNDFSVILRAGSDSAKQTYLAEAKLLEPFSHIEAKIAESTLLLEDTINNHVRDTDWSDDLSEIISDAHTEYAEGNGED